MTLLFLAAFGYSLETTRLIAPDDKVLVLISESEPQQSVRALLDQFPRIMSVQALFFDQKKPLHQKLFGFLSPTHCWLLKERARERSKLSPASRWLLDECNHPHPQVHIPSAVREILLMLDLPLQFYAPENFSTICRKVLDVHIGGFLAKTTWPGQHIAPHQSHNALKRLITHSNMLGASILMHKAPLILTYDNIWAHRAMNAGIGIAAIQCCMSAFDFALTCIKKCPDNNIYYNAIAQRIAHSLELQPESTMLGIVDKEHLSRIAHLLITKYGLRKDP